MTMTTGQRIAAKRRELNLSQEGLGEALGVSRQSIYKWESDASLPDIDKLVALSRLFSVPVGWLLGVEEEPQGGEEELTPAQLRLVEEVFRRYSQERGERLSREQQEQVEELVSSRLDRSRPRRRRWPWVLGAAAVLIGAVSLFQRLDWLEGQYGQLEGSIHNVTATVNGQIGTITNRVEEILKAQNSLTADYGVSWNGSDPAAGTASFTARVVPKTYTPGMSVLFLGESGGEVVEVPGREGENGAFTASFTCPLTDSITLSAVFVTGDTRQTQLLDQFSGLWSDTLPEVIVDFLTSLLVNLFPGEDGAYHLPESYGGVSLIGGVSGAQERGTAQVERVELGLFRGRELVRWLEPCDKPENIHTDREMLSWFRLPPTDFTAREGETVCLAVRVTDEYGRQWMSVSIPTSVVEDGRIGWGAAGDTMLLRSSTEEWSFG